ncbi:MAG: tetratricopeptide repeat protein [Motiliproteus sp.]
MLPFTAPRTLVSLLVLFCLSPLSLAANFYQDALNYQQQGEPKSAIIQLKNLLREEPDNAEARLLLGTLYLQTGQYQGAEKELKRAKTLQSQDPGLALLLVRSLLGQRRFSEAREQLLGLDPDDSVQVAERWLLLGHSYSALRQLDQAEQAYRQAETLAATTASATEIGLSLARLALLQQHPEIALARLKATFAHPRASAEALLIMGQAYLQQRQAALAQKAFDDLLLLQAGHPVALLGRVKALLLVDNEVDARISLDQLLSIAPLFPDALLISAVLHLKAGNPQQAKEILDPLSQQQGQQADVLHLTGYANLLLGHEAQALQQFSRNLVTHPDHDPSRLALAQLYAKQNQFDQAQKILTPLLERDAIATETLALAGTLSLRQGDAVAATEYFQQALTQSERSELSRPLALSELLSGDIDAGIARLEGLSRDDANLQTDTLLLRAYLRAQQLEKARELLTQRIQNHPDDRVYRLMAAALELQLKQFVAAKQHLQAVLLKESRSLPALLGMAYLALQQQAPREAEEWYRQAQEADPDDIRPVQGQIGLALTEGRSKTAAQQAARFYRNQRTRKDAAQLYLSVLQRLGDRDQLQLQLQTMIKDHPDEPSFKLQQADLHFSQGETAVATRQLGQLIIEHPDYMPARIARIKLLLAQQQPQKALDASNNLPAAVLALPSVALLLGDAYQRLNQPAAIDQYLKAYQVKPAPEVAVRLGRAYATRNGADAAIEFLQQHLTKQSQDIAARALLGGLQQQRGNNTEAIRSYQQVTAEQPKHTLAWNNLAWLYQQQNDPRALVAAEQAHKLAPDAGAVIDTLGWILLPSDPQRALRLLAEAAQQLPEDAAVQYHYAAALAKNARPQEALVLLRSLEQKAFADKQEAMALLKKLKG